jgi:hypothetical protein
MNVLSVIAFGAFAVAALYTIAVRIDIRTVLRLHNRPQSYSAELGGYRGLPFNDLEELRDLIEAEPDSILTPKYRRLLKTYPVAVGVSFALFILALILTVITSLA